MIPMNDTYFTLARIVRPRGRIGEVVAEILTDFPERLTGLREVFLADGSHAPRRMVVRRCWLHLGRVIFHFQGVDSIANAERLRGWEIQLPISERVTLPAGQYFITDLIGCEVWDVPEKVPLGIVRHVQPTGEATSGTPLLSVETSRGELLIPFAEDFCVRIDVAARRIEVRLPEGLRDLNE